MLRAPVAGVLTGAALVVMSQPLSYAGAVRHLPGGACVEATVRIVDARLDHLSDVFRAVEQGADPRSLPAVPSADGLAACAGPMPRLTPTD